MEHVIKMMKNGKATGYDEIPIEALKVFDEHNLEVVAELCNTIYNSRYIPTDMKQSIFIPLPKKPKAQKCDQLGPINIVYLKSPNGKTNSFCLRKTGFRVLM